MLKANLNKVLLGSTVQLNWDVSNLRFNYFLYLKKSHKASNTDKKWKRIDEKGSQEIIVTDKDFECKLRKLTFLGWKTIGTYKPEVRILDVQTPASQLNIPQIVLSKRPSLKLRLSLPKFKKPGLRIHLPTSPVIPVIQYENEEPTHIINQKNKL